MTKLFSNIDYTQMCKLQIPQSTSTKTILVFLIILLFCIPSFAIPLPFETSAVGRAQGSSIGDLEGSLDFGELQVKGAEYYTDKQLIAPTFFSQGEEEKTAGVLQGVHGFGNVKTHGGNWGFDMVVSSKVPGNKALILQSEGVASGSPQRAFDGYSSGKGLLESQATPISGIPLNEAIEGGNLVIADVDYAGTYIPTMGKADSFTTQLAGKAGALIATNGFSSPAFVKALVCSLALKDASFGKNDYYKFDSIGDRFRNAKNNLAEFGGETQGVSDYSLYGQPYLKVKSQNQMQPSQLSTLCGDFAKYNTYPFSQSVSLHSAQPQQEPVYSKEISMVFSEYKVVSENGFQMIDLNGALQRLSEGKPVLPQAISELEFPLGTIVREVKIVSKTSPVDLDLNALPMWNGQGFSEMACNGDGNVLFEATPLYTEDKEIIVVKVIPVETVDCAKGKFRLYREVEIEANYTPYSQILIRKIGSRQEAFPNEIVDVNVSLENISPTQALGKLKIIDSSSVAAEKDISIPAGEQRNETVSIKLGEEEGFYDYIAQFEQNSEVKSQSNFKIKAEVLSMKLEFVGSKQFFDDFESTQMDFKWETSTNSTGGTNYQNVSSISQSNGALHLEAVSEPNDNERVSESGSAWQKEGLALYNPETTIRFHGGISGGGHGPGASGGEHLYEQAFEAFYNGPKNFLQEDIAANGQISFDLTGRQWANYEFSNESVTYAPYGDPYASTRLTEIPSKLLNLGVITLDNIPTDRTDPMYNESGGKGYLNEERYCNKIYNGSNMTKGCVKSGSYNDIRNTDNSRVHGVFAIVNGNQRYYQESLTDWHFMHQPATSFATNAFSNTITIGSESLKNYYNRIELTYVVNGDVVTNMGAMDIYVEPRECNGPDYAALKASGVCAGRKRFAIDELPLTMVLRDMSEIRENLDRTHYNSTKLGGNYLFEKENSSTIKWKKAGSVDWKLVDVSGWNTNNLGFDIQYKANAWHNSNENRGYGNWLVSIGLFDGKKPDSAGSHYKEVLDIHSNGDIPSNTGSKMKISINIGIDEIARQFTDSARGTAYFDAVFENKSGNDIQTTGKYTLEDEKGNTITGEIKAESIPSGTKTKRVALQGFNDRKKDYRLTLQADYKGRTRIAGTSFSGNRGPQITGPSRITANAFETIELGRQVIDPDNDPVQVTITPPFSQLGGKWETTEADVGTKEVTVSATDGIETTTKKIIVEILPPTIKCSADPDCGSTITINPRVCDNGALFAMEKKPICLNAGTFKAKCSFADVNRVYGYCGFKGEFSNGEAKKTLKFSEAGSQTLYVEIPRKATATKATVKISGKKSYSQCFDMAQNFDLQNSTAKKYEFKNGKKFVGLPVGGPVTAASNEVTSDLLEGFPTINFSSNTKGIASGLDIHAYCRDTGGRYLQFIAPCQGGVGDTATGDYTPACSSPATWIHSDFKGPESEAGPSDFCKWQGTVSISPQTNLNTVYNKARGYYSGLDQKPAFRAYVQQFQSGKELYLGNVGAEVKRVSLSANEELHGQNIEYFYTVDGSNWKPITNNTSQEFRVNEIGKTFNAKAILRTSDPAQTPRITNTNICTETFGAPNTVILDIGKNGNWTMQGKEGFSTEIEVTGTINKYLSGLPPSYGNVLVPITIFAPSIGIVEVEGLWLEFDANTNTAPAIEKIPDQNAFIGEQFTLQVKAIDMENDKLAYSDDSGLFDINPVTGLISFSPRKNNIGDHEITISVSDGNLSTSANINITILNTDMAPRITSVTSNSPVKENEPLIIEASAVDPDNDLINYSIDSPIFTVEGNKFTWQTDYSSAGEYKFVVTASDGTLSHSKEINVKVTNTNRQPMIEVKVERESFTIDDEVVITVKATDPDNDKLEITSDIDAFAFDGKGTFRMLTSQEMIGEHNAGITASDGVNAVTKYVTFKITYWPGMEPCFDSDNGLNYYEQGYAQNRLEGGPKHYDACIPRAAATLMKLVYVPEEECTGASCNLQEVYCNGLTISNIAQYCENGCKQGACIKKPQVGKASNNSTTEQQPGTS